jgi:regulator of extracellular matrix RemA (YlzA/DUF370 family)
VARLVNVGYGNFVVAARVVAVVDPSSAPIKRLKDEAREGGRLVDATQGRRTRSVLITDSDHLILSALQPETLAARFLLPAEQLPGSGPPAADDDEGGGAGHQES